jgi:hypothetical protein
MRESAAFGINLAMTRKVTAVLGGSTIHIEDEVENLSSSRSTPLMFAYHCNPGFPILDGTNSRLDFHTSQSEDRDAPGIAVPRESWSSFAPPGSHEDPELVDRVWFHQPIPTADTTHTTSHVNPRVTLL